MKSYDWTKLFTLISDFARDANPSYDVLEFWLDTSVAKVAKQSPSMYLVFYGFNCHENLESLFEKVQQTNDFSLVAFLSKNKMPICNEFKT